MQKRTITAAALAATTVLTSALATSTSASAAPASKAVPNTKPAWTAKTKPLGHAASSSSVSARVYLAPKGGTDALKKEALAVSTPGNAQYRKFLTSAQYAKKYGTSASTVKSVESYLKSAGLKVTGVGASNRYVTVSGTVAAAKKAFGTTIDTYKHNGETVHAPSGSVVLPASIASAVSTVTGLDTTTKTMAPASKQQAQPAGFRNAAPCSTYYGQIAAKYQADYKTPLPAFNGKTLSYAPCGYTGPQFRSAYEGNTTLDGSGVTVAIVDAYASPSIAKDANTYATNHGDGAYAGGQLVQTKASKFVHGGNGPKGCGATGWYGEETLDVEAVHAMAPGANIHYYGAASCYDDDFLDTLAQTVDDDAAQLISNSWGEAAEAESADAIAAYEQVFMQGAVQGQSFLFSSGDDGDELANTGIKQSDLPTSDPYVTSVGGTSTGIGADGSISFQTGWGTDKYSLSSDGKSWTAAGYLYGAGGGTSTLFNQPAYQKGTTKSAYRQNPDVAMDADPNTGMLVGETQTFSDGTYYDEYRIGGTSLASPLFAGITALTLQHTGSGLGLLNPVIYANQKDFTDVLPASSSKKTPAGDVRVDFANSENADGGLLYSVRTFDNDSSLPTTKGYDTVTGVGTPNSGWTTLSTSS
jgi:subtilase family serine protease